jgi:hypothetical protein
MQLGGSANFYFILFGVLYLAWWRFRDEFDKGTASNFVQISEKVRRKPWQWLDKRSGNKAWAIHRKSKLTETEEEARQAKSEVKGILVIFFDITGIVHKEFVLAGQTVDSAYYCDILRRLHENVRRIRLELWRQKYWFLHHDNAEIPTSFFTGEFFIKNNMTVVPHPFHFSLFPRLKIKVKGRHFDTIEMVEAEALRTVRTRGRGLFRGRWWPIGPKLVFNQMAALVPEIIYSFLPIAVAARSKAWTVSARSNTGIVGSNPT